jgi:Tol biopolymer transport system component/DNA-binding winged helix-turn-helix (wHTH) protein
MAARAPPEIEYDPAYPGWTAPAAKSSSWRAEESKLSPEFPQARPALPGAGSHQGDDHDMDHREPAAAFPGPRAAAGCLRFGPFELDLGDRLLRKDGAELALPPRAYGVLEVLLARPGRLVAKRDLIDGVWKDACVTETSLTEAVGVLRQVLGDDPQHPTYVQTLHRRGYRFIAPVSTAAPAAPARSPLAPALAAAAPARPAPPDPAFRAPGAVPAPANPAPANPAPAIPALANPARAGGRRPVVGLLLAAAAAAVLAGGLALYRARVAGAGLAAAPSAVNRLLIALPLDHELDADLSPALALSPRGDRLVYLGRAAGVRRLYLRPLDRFEATSIDGSEGAAAPFFSPDGEWVGFFAAGKLKKVALAGGAPVTLCAAEYGYGGTWGGDGMIVFSPGYASGLQEVSAAGGTPRNLTAPNRSRGELGHRWPEFLPGGRAVLFTATGKAAPGTHVELLDLATGDRLPLLDGSFAHYSPTGHLVLLRDGELEAAAFDLAARRVLAPPAALLDGLAVNPQGSGQFALAANGTLVYLRGSPEAGARELVWMTPGSQPGSAPGGRTLPAPARRFQNLVLSPDGGRLALTLRTGERSDIWTYELARGTLARLTSEGDNVEPVWSPDGKWIAFASARGGGPYELARARADGSRPPEAWRGGARSRFPGSFSPDGKLLAFAEEHPVSDTDLWVLPLPAGAGGAAGEALPFLRTPHQETLPRFSPDGRWLAYQSDESERSEVYVRPYPGPGGKWQISTDGGTAPVWAADGRQLFYRHGNDLMAVALRTAAAGELVPAAPEVALAGVESSRYALGPGGRGFIVLRSMRSGSSGGHLDVVLGWSLELQRLAPRPR